MSCLSLDVFSISGVIIEQVDRRVGRGVETRFHIFQVEVDFREKVGLAGLEEVVAKVVEHVRVVLNVAVVSAAFLQILVQQVFVELLQSRKNKDYV